MVNVDLVSWTPDNHNTSIKDVTVSYCVGPKNVVQKVGGDASITLYAWKHNSTYIYTKELPTSAGTVAVIKNNPLADATGTYVEATPEAKHDAYKIGTDFVNSDLSAATEPAGTAGTPVDLGDVVLNDTKYYVKDTDWYEVTGLTKTSITHSDTAETDASLIAALEAATAVEADYIEYTEAAVPAHITVSATDYERSSDKDYTLGE